jgi:hypothetical protein
MFKSSLKKVSVLAGLLILIKNYSLNATPMTDEQNQNCKNIASANQDNKVITYKKFVESLTDTKTKEKLKHHGDKANEQKKDLNEASNECLNKFCESINASDKSLSIQQALDKAYLEEIKCCRAEF